MLAVPGAAAELDLGALSRACGIPLHAYRPQHVARCVQRALTRTGQCDIAELTQRLDRDPAARGAFRRSVLVAVTGMFRDPQEFEILERVVIPQVAGARGRFSVWSAGCADGQELCSVAKLLEQAGMLRNASLLGSDVLDEALDRANAARAGFSLTRQAVIRYERRDLVTDPPPKRTFDLVMCRNVSIYLEPTAQRDLRLKLVDVLRPSGFLMLGCSETIIDPQALGLTPASRHIWQRTAA